MSPLKRGLIALVLLTTEVAAQTPHLVVGVEKDFAPFAFRTRENELTGFDVELLRLIAAELAGDATFVEVSWLETNRFLMRGHSERFVIAAGALSITPERQAKVAFSTPYLVSGQRLITAKSQSFTVENDWSGKRIAVQMETTGLQWLRRHAPTASPLPKPTALGTLQSVVTGEAEGAVLDEVITAYLLKTRPEFVDLVLQPPRLNEESYGFAAPLIQKPLLELVDTALQHLKERGEYEKLRLTWFGDPLD